MVHEVTIFQERQAMASAKEIFRLMGQKEIYIYKKSKFWLLSKFFILKWKYYFFRKILKNVQKTGQ